MRHNRKHVFLTLIFFYYAVQPAVPEIPPPSVCPEQKEV